MKSGKKAGLVLSGIIFIFLLSFVAFKNGVIQKFGLKIVSHVVSQKFNCKIEKVGNFTGGFFQEVRLEDVVISWSDYSFHCEKIITKISLYSLLFQRDKITVSLLPLKIYHKSAVDPIFEGIFNFKLVGGMPVKFLNCSGELVIDKIFNLNKSYRVKFKISKKDNLPGVDCFAEVFSGEIEVFKPISFTLLKKDQEFIMENLRGNYYDRQHKFIIRGKIRLKDMVFKKFYIDDFLFDNLVGVKGTVDLGARNVAIKLGIEQKDVREVIELINKIRLLFPANIINKVSEEAIAVSGELTGWFDNFVFRGEGEFLEKTFSFTANVKNRDSVSLSFNLNDNYKIKAELLSDQVDINCLINKGKVSEFLFLGANKRKRLSLEGTLNGVIEVKGPKSLVQVDGKLQVENLKVEDYLFDNGYINIQGVGSIIMLVNSHFFYKDSVFALEGYLDFNESNLFKNVKFVPRKLNNFYWEGVEFSKGLGNDGFKVKKDLNERVTLSVEAERDAIDKAKNRNSELEVEYRLEGNKDLILKFNNKDSLVGVKRSLAF